MTNAIFSAWPSAVVVTGFRFGGDDTDSENCGDEDRADCNDDYSDDDRDQSEVVAVSIAVLASGGTSKYCPVFWIWEFPKIRDPNIVPK